MPVGRLSKVIAKIKANHGRGDEKGQRHNSSNNARWTFRGSANRALACDVIKLLNLLYKYAFVVLSLTFTNWDGLSNSNLKFESLTLDG